MALEGEFRNATMACVAGRAEEDIFTKFAELESGYNTLLEETEADDTLVSAVDLRNRIADLTDWRGRAFENARQFDEAIDEFDRAAQLFDAIGKTAEAQRSRDKASEVRLETTADFDMEIERLRQKLETVQPGGPEQVKTLIALGELHSRANDDFEAVRLLEQAEAGLLEVGGHPSDNDILGAMADTVAQIEGGELVAGFSSLESSVERRALTQRLYLALANAYRTTDPARAAEYEAKLRSYDDGKRSNMQQLLGQFLDADQDVGRFLKGLHRDKD